MGRVAIWRITVAVVVALACTGMGAGSAGAVLGHSPAGADRGPATAWLCNPAMVTDPCNLPGDTTDLRTGQVADPPPVTAADRPVDCFYVYPTVTNQPALIADLGTDPVTTAIAELQAARFGSQCRMFAPIYRQATLFGLTPALLDTDILAPAYADVLNAWNDYLAHDNHGRGVILIGHSQGTMMLRKLIREQIDPDPALRAQLVGALLLGGNVKTAPASTVGGDFQNIPLCTQQGESGCVIAYSTTIADPAVSIFGNSTLDPLSHWMGLPIGPQYQVACTDPAVLSGDNEAVGLTLPSAPFAPGIISALLGYSAFPRGLPTSASTWTTAEQSFTGQCVDANGYRLYQFQATDPAGQRLNEIPLFETHLVDMNVGLDRLVSIAHQQTINWLAHR
ncbi:MAG: hypothetical protein JWN03_1659 [Nocardia sp.]|uniref:DUF3089 domain-containing protein n=1 Tax=Nocardia sp. TaxID=1821 RepID=UPI00261E7192|nr:DUF3089 domain-containing protein [Nocardia sp.]MCU1641384.1 hypothetical protein [Nocardia sp.]